MRILTKTLLAGAVAAAMLPSVANAYVSWNFNYADAFTADGATRGYETPALSPNVDELKFTAESVVTFKDVDGNGFISAGDTFKDYIYVRVDQLFYQGNDNTDTRYGAGSPSTTPRFNLPGNHEITVKLLAEGVQTGTNSYDVTNISIMDWYFDAGTDTLDGNLDITGVTGYTRADFSNLATFTDGKIVENSTLIVGGGSNDGKFPDGNINLTVKMNDLLHTLDNNAYDDFELYGPRYSMIDYFLGVSDSNNNRCTDSGGSALCSSSAAAILGGFGAAPLDITFHTRSDGSFVKEIPEPGSLALLALGALGIGFAGFKRRKAV